MTLGLLALVLFWGFHTQAIIYDIPNAGQKCITYDLMKYFLLFTTLIFRDDVMVGEYEIMDPTGAKELYDMRLTVAKVNLGNTDYQDVVCENDGVHLFARL